MLRYALYLFSLIGFLAAAAFGYLFIYRYPYWKARAFVGSSVSMCPTICEHERILALIDPAKQLIPLRNDVIVMDHQGQALFVKRVVGLPGDVISPGPRNEILINGKPWQPPPVCGNPDFKPEANAGLDSDIPFVETRVPQGSYFVIGDNLPHSLDSRTESFGFVPLGKIYGKALIMYYSPRLSRIGCQIQ